MTTPFNIKFHVPGSPIPKQRPQVTSQGVYYAARPRGSARLSYTEYKELVQGEAVKAMGHVLAKMISVYREEWKLGDWALSVTARLGAGDFDNVAGSIADALQGILWANDKQILMGHQRLTRVGPTEPRGVDVEAWILEE